MNRYYIIGVFFCLFFTAVTLRAQNSGSYTPSQKYLEYVDSASNCVINDEIEKAERWIVKALNLEPASPNNAMLFSNLCKIQLGLNRPSDALKSIEAAISRMPECALFLYYHALCNLTLGDKTQALKDIEKALTIDPKYDDAMLLKASLLLETGDTVGASELLGRVMDINPDSEEALYGLAMCYELQEDWEDAKTYYTRLIDMNPTAELYLLRGTVSARKEDYSSVYEDVKNGLLIDPFNGNLFYLKSLADRKCYRIKEAEANEKLANKYGVDHQMFLWVN